MCRLLDLPLSILEDIVAFVLDCQATTNVLKAEQYIHPFNHKPASRRTNARHLLLSSKTLNQVTSYIIHSRVIFYIPNDDIFKRFTTTAGTTTLNQIRHAEICLYNNDDVSPPPDSELGKHIAIGTDLLSKLPAELRSLCLVPPYHNIPYYVTSHRCHPLLVEQLKRFSSLQDLHLDFFNSWLDLSMFSSTKYRTHAYQPQNDPSPLPSMFPNLRRLHIEGCINYITGPADMARALSQGQLPSLQVLIVEALLYDAGFHGAPVFAPEAISGMNPLIEFTWILYDHGSKMRRTDAEPDPPMVKGHLEALRERHGKTLQKLSMNYTGHRQVNLTDVPDKEDFETFLKGFDTLTGVSIICPQKGIDISR